MALQDNPSDHCKTRLYMSNGIYELRVTDNPPVRNAGDLEISVFIPP